MPLEPEIKILSTTSRSWFFWSLLVIFVVSLPAFIFYTSGNRLSFEETGTTVVTTGGMYVTTDNLEVDVYLDEEQVQRPRLFRSAYYIQNIESGYHRVVVQSEGVHTWVKELPVDPYIVTEAAAFNMPLISQYRPIAEYIDASGQSVYFAKSTSTALFPNATTSETFVIQTKRATSTLSLNQEFVFVDNLFSSTSTRASLLDRIGTQIERFQFSTTTEKGIATATLSYIEKGNMRLAERGTALYAVWAGSQNNIPHYFCVVDAATSTIAERYGEHVMVQVEKQRLSTSTPLLVDGNRLCRTEIKIDNKWMGIKMYNFLPDSTDLVVLQLEDGLYVTEIDDRSWQNTQLLYPGSDFETIVTDDAIYVKENGRYIELLTEIPTN